MDNILITAVVAFVIGALFGAWWYRRTLKTDPAKLERFAAEVKATGVQAEQLAQKAKDAANKL